MNPDRKVVDITEYARERETTNPAPGSPHGSWTHSVVTEVRNLAGAGRHVRHTPVAVCGLLGLVTSLAFLAYVGVRAAEVGVFDSTVLLVVALDAAIAGMSLGMVLAAPRIRRIARRTAPARGVRQVAAEAAPPVSIEEARKRRASASNARCPACGATYELVALDGSCPACGDIARSA